MSDNFQNWMKRVDNILTRTIGIDSMSLPDIDWWEMWASGMHPNTAYRAAKILWGAEF